MASREDLSRQQLLLVEQTQNKQQHDESNFSYLKSSKHRTTHSRPNLNNSTIQCWPQLISAKAAKHKPEFQPQVARRCSSLLTIVLLVLMIILINKQEQQQFSEVEAFNVDSQSALVHTGPSNSYFGYTVALHKDRGVNWLLVGAPKAQTDQSKVKEAGAVYRCSTTNPKACQQFVFDPTGSSVVQLRNESRQSDDKSRQWFGASLQSATDNGFIIACAPRYVYFSTNLRRRDPVGTCWVSRGSFSGFMEYSPCRLNEQWGHHHLGSCQAGFSSAISKDGSRIFMGAPGSHVWQGQVFAHNLKSDLTNATSGVNPHSEDDSYLGYSLALGKFSSSTTSSNSASDTDLAIGIPHGADLAGKIMIVDREMRVLRNVTGEQMGAYFGYSIAAADVNGDGLEDLIIGAPLFYNQTISHKEAHFERGRVYVALQNSRHELTITNRIDGRKNRARFGTAIANCGDLNRDGFQDVAVGAPYDGRENRGAIYIFMGRKGGLLEEPDQVIYAEDIRHGLESNNLRSFGFSISGGLDMDDNQYPDLLVGDYLGDRAVMLRTRPVVNVTASLNFQPEYFNLDDKKCSLPSNSSIKVSCVNVEYCIKYNGLQVENRLPFVFDIKLDTENKGQPRLFFLNNEGKNEERNSTTLAKDEQKCKQFKAYIIREIRDKLTPLKVDLEYNLADYSGDTYDYAKSQPKLRPVLNKSVPNKMSKVVTIQKNCGHDNICVPDLKLTVNPNIDQYTIGSNEKLILDVTVKNYGEDAFESMFYLTMPLTINYITINKTRSDYPDCYAAKPDQTGVNILTCDLGNPQQRNDVVKFSVITEPARGIFSAPDFTFVATVNSTNPEQDDKAREDNQVAIGIPIRVEVNLVLSGNSNPPLVGHNSTHSTSNINRPKLSEADVGQEVYHIYQLQNRGPSTINDIALTILWPTKTIDGQYLLYLVDEPQTSDKVVCKPAPKDAINPLGLKYLRGNSVTSPQQQQQQQQQTANANPANRYKRQATTATTTSQQNSDQPVPTTTIDNSVLQQLHLTCGPTQCNRFECNVFDLGHNELATIKIRSRLWEETLDKISMQEFDISSKLVAQVKALPYNVSSQSMQPDIYKVETEVHTTGLGVQDLLSWWVVALAVLLGIALFVLLACFLKYLGFFARKRPPKGPEREPLTPTLWDNYQYTPGDTAL